MRPTVFIRQGDILLEQIDTGIVRAPSNMTPINNSRTLALGEATGHHHSFTNPQQQVLLYRDAKNGKPTEPELVQVVSEEGATLTHQEHKAIHVPQGTYKVVREQEYNPFLKQLQRTVD